ncbi:MAG: isochorismatase family protein [Candidatus Poribacteria bacterium]|nr:isochorismatase family protein [Candidatus Poribacteria bacterium]
MKTKRLKPKSAALLLIDAQERIMPAMHDPERALNGMRVAVLAALALDLPVRVTEQYPKGLGRTMPPLIEALGEAYQPIEKTRFSAGTDMWGGEIESVLLCGIEAHVCVLQTALDLIDAGYHAFALVDAVDSRSARNKSLGLERMRQSGAVLVSTETALFELLQDARHPRFKELQGLIK